MEENDLPPASSMSSKDTSNSLDVADANAPVASYSLSPKTYPIENLEVHSEKSGSVVSASTPTIRQMPYSRRKAIIISLAITLMVVLMTGVSLAYMVRKNTKQDSAVERNIPTQGVSLNTQVQSGVPPELQGAEEALLVNGDIVTRGTIKVVSGDFINVLRVAPLTADREFILPDASGTICLDSNNCGNATQGQVAQNTAQLVQLQQQIAQIVIPPAGVQTLNGQNGAVSIQGSTNQITVTTANGVITLSTPQDLDANANVQFSSLTLGAGGQIISNGLSFVDNARTFTFPAGGLASQEICTNQGNCGGGGGSVSSVNSMTGAITIQGTANQINVANGAGTVTLSTPQDIATTSNVQFNNLNLSGNADVNGTLAVGSTATPPANSAVSVAHTLTGDCSFSCSGILVNLSSTVNSIGNYGVYSRIDQPAGSGTFAAVSFYAASATSAGSIGDNYGLFVDSQTVGANDYGVYVEAADTYGIWIDAGLSRFDGGLEVQGANPFILEGVTDNAFETTIAVVDPTADRTITLPNASGTVCLDSGNCLGGTGGAPNTANYLVTALDGTLTNERAMLAGSNIAFTDGGAGGNFTIATVQNPTFTTSVTTPLLTSTGALAITPGGALTVGATSQTALLQGSTATITSTGAGNDITLTSADQIILNGVTDINNYAAVGNSAAPQSIAGLSIGHSIDSSTNCTGFGCYGILSNIAANNVGGASPGLSGFYSGISVTAGSLFQAAGFFAADSAGAGTVTNNYGVFVANQTKGTNDYGVYIQGADSYALWVDSGISRFDGNLEFEGATDDAFELTVGVADPTADRTITLPNATGTVCLDSGNCIGGGGSAPGSAQYLTLALDGSLSAERVLTAGSNISLTDGGANANLTVATVQNPTFTTSVTTPLLQSSGALSITSSGIGSDITLTSPDQIILDTGTGGTEINGFTAVGNSAVTSFITGLTVGQTFTTASCPLGCYGSSNSVTADGVTSGFVSGGLFQAQTAAVAFTLPEARGASIAATILGAGSTITDNYGLYVGSQTAGTNDYGVYIQGADSYALWVDSGISRFDGNLEFEGATDDAFEFTLAVADPTADRTYTIPNSSAGTDTFCLVTLGNCAGSGGGITGSGTTNRVAKFTASGTIGDSTITDDGTNVSITGDFTIQGGGLTVGTAVQPGSLLLHDGDGETITLNMPDVSASYSLIFPAAVGTANQCLKAQNGTGTLFWDDCLGGGGGGGGIASLDGQTGPAITINNATGAANVITIDDAAADGATKGIAAFNGTNFSASSGVINTIQGISTAATPQFAGLTLTGNLQVDGNTTLGNASGDTLTINSAAVTTPNNLNFDTNTLFIDAANDRIGIGNAAPGAALEVTGDIYLTKEAARTIKVADSTTAATAGGALSILGANGNGADGGAITVKAGDGAGAGNGGVTTIQGGDSFANGGNLNLYGGEGPNNGGTVSIRGGYKSGVLDGSVNIQSNQFVIHRGGDIDATSSVASATAYVFDATDATADGLSIDIQSSADTEYVFQATSNNGATTGLIVKGDGSVAIGTSATTSAFTNNVLTIQSSAKDEIYILGDTAYNMAAEGATYLTFDRDDDHASSEFGILTGNTSGGGVTQLFTVEKDGDLISTGTGTFQGSSVTIGTAGLQGSLRLQDGDGETVSITIDDIVANSTIKFRDTTSASDFFCLENLGNCAGVATDLQAAYTAGNSISATDAEGNISFSLTEATDFVVNSTTANNVIEFQRGATPYATFNSDGNGAVTLRPTTDSTSAFNVRTRTGDGNLLTVDTSNARVGINLGGTATPTLAGVGQGMELRGALRVSGGGSSSLMDDYTTPDGAAVGAKVNIVNATLGSDGSQMIAAGLLSGSSSNARVVAAFDDRASAHQPSIGALAPDENSIFGLSYDGSTSNAYLKTWDVTTAETIVIRSSIGLLNTDNVDIASFARTGISLLQNTVASGTISAPHSGTQSERFGASTSATGSGALAVGYGATANGNFSTALGWSASTGTTTNSLAVGYNAQVGHLNNVAIGYNSVSGIAGVGSQSVALGSGATTGNRSNAVAIGYNASVTQAQSVAIGASATADQFSVAIGNGATASGNGTVSIGQGALGGTAANSIAIGQGATLGANNSIAIGIGATTTSTNQMVIGGSTTPIGEVYIGDGVTDATPTNVVLHATGGSGTDIAGASFTLAGGVATGNAAGGSILFQTSDPGGSGASPQALTTKATLLANGNFGIGDITPDAKFDIDATFSPATTGTTTNTGSGLTVTNTVNKTAGSDTTYGQQISVTRTGATGGTIDTYGLDIQGVGSTGGTSTLYGLNVNVSGADTNYAGVFQGGNVVLGGVASPDIILGDNGSAVFNEQGANVDFRVEGDTDANTLFVDASANAVGIGTNTPSRQLHVNDPGTGGGGLVVGTGTTDLIELFHDGGWAYQNMGENEFTLGHNSNSFDHSGRVNASKALFLTSYNFSNSGGVMFRMDNISGGGTGSEQTVGGFDNNADFFIERSLNLGVHAFAPAGAATLTPTSAYVEADCSNGAGCAITMSETSPSVVEGDVLFIVNVGTNNVTIADSAGVVELGGNTTWGNSQWDSLTLLYTGDRWVEIARSDN